MVAAGRRRGTDQPRNGGGHPLPLQGEHPRALAQAQGNQLTSLLVESRMRWKSHVRFGRRPGETEQWKHGHRAPGRLQLAGDALDGCRRRIQQDLHGHRGRATDPLYRARRTLRCGRALLTDKQKTRLDTLFSTDDTIAVEVTWCVYQDIIDAYRTPDRNAGQRALARVIDIIQTGVPRGLADLAQLGRTMQKRRDDILAWFDHPGSSNGPTEAIQCLRRH